MVTTRQTTGPAGNFQEGGPAVPFRDIQTYLRAQQAWLSKQQSSVITASGRDKLTGGIEALRAAEIALKQFRVVPAQECAAAYKCHALPQDAEELAAQFLAYLGLPNLPVDNFRDEQWRVELEQALPGKAIQIALAQKLAANLDLVSALWEMMYARAKITAPPMTPSLPGTMTRWKRKKMTQKQAFQQELQQRALDALCAPGPGMTPSELAARLNVTRTTATRYVKHLLEEGLLAKHTVGHYNLYAVATTCPYCGKTWPSARKMLLHAGECSEHDLSSNDPLATKEPNQIIAEIQKTLGLPAQIKTTASRYYSVLKAGGVIRSRRPPAVAAACVWVACKEIMVPVKVYKIAKIACVTRSAVVLARKGLFPGDLVTRVPPCPAEIITPIASQLSISRGTCARAEAILAKAITILGPMSQDPASLAAAALRLATLEENSGITLSALADAAGISVVSLRGHVRRLQPASTLPDPPEESQSQSRSKRAKHSQAPPTGDLSTLSGIGPRRLQLLNQVGIDSIAALAAQEPCGLEARLTKADPRARNIFSGDFVGLIATAANFLMER
jgi:DNA-binding Lrp family transcriptional regulator/predicted flap endonuclease-1-like 5' DNA nuclease